MKDKIFLLLTYVALTLTFPAHAACEGAQRIISLLPSLTETLCYLGGCDRLVATDRYANWPDAVRHLPKLGGLDGFSLEAAMALRPDCVLVGQHQRETDRLASLGVPVWVLPMARLEDVDRVMLAMRSRLRLGVGADIAQKRWQQSLRDTQQRLAERVQVPGSRLLIPIDRELYVFGRGSYWDDVLIRLGVHNAVPVGIDQAFPKISLEWVLRHPPDRLVVSAALRRELERLPGWSARFQDGHYCVIPKDLHDAVMRPGPRLLLAMDWLVGCLGGS